MPTFEHEDQNHALVSIVLPVFNGERFLRESINSILVQTFTDFELIISDNASTDSTQAICLEYASIDSRILYHRQKTNLGILGNTEWLYQHARGKFLMLIGDDDVYESDCLERYVERMLLNNNLDIVYSDFEYIDMSGNRTKSGLKIFMKAEDSIYKNLHAFIRSKIVLPMGLGLFRTSVVKKALPIPIVDTKNYSNFTGGRDIIFLWKMLTSSKVDSVPIPLFCYRIKDRSGIIPINWGVNPIKIKLNLMHLNWLMLVKHIIPEIISTKFNSFQKLFLIMHALFIFIAQYSLIPIKSHLSSFIKF